MNRSHWLPILAATAAALLLVAAPMRAGASEDSALYQESYSSERVGDFRGAIAALGRTSEPAQATYFHQLRLGWLLYLAGQYDASLAAYTKAVALEPAAVEPYLGLLLPQIASRAWTQAEKTARAALERDPGSYLARSRLAWVLFSQGRHAEAEIAYRKVLDLYPSDLEMRAGLGWALLEQGKHRAAEAELRRVLDAAPTYESARSGIEEIRRATGR